MASGPTNHTSNNQSALGQFLSAAMYWADQVYEAVRADAGALRGLLDPNTKLAVKLGYMDPPPWTPDDEARLLYNQGVLSGYCPPSRTTQVLHELGSLDEAVQLCVAEMRRDGTAGALLQKLVACSDAFEALRASAKSFTNDECKADCVTNAWAILMNSLAELAKFDSPSGDAGLPSEERQKPESSDAIDQAALEALPRCARLAYVSYWFIEEKHGTLKDKDAYALLKEQSDERLLGYELPAFHTWERYLRTARAHLSKQKNMRRHGRPAGGSVVREREI